VQSSKEADNVTSRLNSSFPKP